MNKNRGCSPRSQNRRPLDAAAFFKELLTGRAFVYTKPYNKDQSSDESDRTAGIFFGTGGKAFICTRQKGSTKGLVRSWRMIPSGKHGAILALHRDKDDPANHRHQQVLFYDGESGRLHIERWSPDGACGPRAGCRRAGPGFWPAPARN